MCIVTADSSEVEGLIADFEALLAEAPKLPLEIRNRLVNLLESGLQIGGVETLTTGETAELRVRLNFADSHTELVAALRARNRNLRVQV